jgi:hypothetical protein
MTLSRKMHLIAFRVRNELEQKRLSGETAYAVESTLGGLCGEASDRIVALARRAGIRGVRVTANECHAFVRWTEGKREWLIDVTATQFNNRRPRVVMQLVTSMTRTPHYWRELE